VVCVNPPISACTTSTGAAPVRLPDSIWLMYDGLHGGQPAADLGSLLRYRRRAIDTCAMYRFVI
jgi:hypothetical protein